MNLHTCSTLL